MKRLTNYFTQKNILFKELEAIEPKTLQSRKKIEIYSALSIQGEYYAIFIIEAKSRFLRKQAQEIIDLTQRLIHLKDHNFKKKILLISSPLCSKAKKFLQEEGWSVKNDFM